MSLRTMSQRSLTITVPEWSEDDLGTVQQLIRDGDVERFNSIMIQKKTLRLLVDDLMECCFEAVRWPFEQFLDHLLTAGDLDFRTTFLIEAIGQSSTRSMRASRCETIAKRLIELSPEVALRRKEQTKTPMHVAARAGAEAILRQLMDTCKASAGQLALALSSNVPEDGTPLSSAIYSHKLAAIAMLIDAHLEEGIPPQSDVLKRPIKKLGAEDDTVALIVDKFPQVLTLESLESIVTSGSPSTWDLAMAKRPELLAQSNILHLAVKAQKVEMVRKILNQHPDLVAQKDQDKRYALQYNQSLSQEVHGLNTQEEIRELLLPEIVRRFNAADIKEMFRKAENKLADLTLNLTPFDRRTHHFTEFLKLVNAGAEQQESQGFRFSFENILRSVDFPDLGKEPFLPSEHRTVSAMRNEVQQVLNWLRTKKDVKKIIGLSVKDSFYDPHSEETIEQAIADLDIEVLNWKRLDLSIDSIYDSARNVRELHLYCSGSKTAIMHWIGDSGIQRLERLHVLHIVIIRDRISLQRAQELERIVKDYFMLLQKIRPELKPQVSVENWSQSTSAVFEEKGIEVDRKLPLKLTGLRDFMDFYRPFQRKELEDKSSKARRIKIAVIDNGFDVATIGKNVMVGRSFVYDNRDRECNWFIATDPHGTQMASFITQLDPFCELYVAKVGNGRADFTEDAVVEAIEFALSNHVDVISMSFCLYPRRQSTLSELKAALKRAHKADVVLICSTHDEGNKALEALPAQHSDTIAIACCDENNKLIQEGSTYDPQYLVRGTGFSTDAISYIDSESSIRGSSVATAIAAGLASLILACHHFTVGRVEERTAIVKAAFDRMAKPSPDRQDLKSVQPHTLFPQRVMEREDGKEWIKEHFKEP